MDPKVTIVMPVFNGGHYFKLALDSALAQTYGNVEIIVVNDGSTDGGETERIALQYGDRVRYIHQENTGVGGAVNTGIQHMTGDFFCWLSHDDVFFPHKTSSQVEYHRRLGKSDAILFSNYELIDPDGKLMTRVQFKISDLLPAPMMALLRGYINGCTVFVPAHIMREFAPLDTSLRYTQDYDLWNRVLSKYEFFLQEEWLIQYRLHPNQDTQKPAATAEGNRLWKRMIDSRSDCEKVQLAGSTKRYYAEMAKFLDATPYAEAAAYARLNVEKNTSRPLVSVIIPIYNEIASAVKAAQSVLCQTYSDLELLLIDDGSTEDIAALEELTRADTRVHCFRQPNEGASAARNRGLALAKGEYIAFLDADDLFVPHKIQRQLNAMRDSGKLLSHTSYFVTFFERYKHLGSINSGIFSGNVYPKILSDCQIATPTVMLHRSLVNEGFQFPAGAHLAEDIVSWIWVARHYPILGIEEPLTVVAWSSTSAALRLDKMVQALTFIIGHVRSNPVDAWYEESISALMASSEYLSKVRHRLASENPQMPFGDLLYEPLISSIFG